MVVQASVSCMKPVWFAFLRFAVGCFIILSALPHSLASLPASPFPHTMYPGDLSVESRIPESARQALAEKGHKVRVGGAWSMGCNAAIVVDLTTGLLSAGADPRVDAHAWAW